MKTKYTWEIDFDHLNDQMYIVERERDSQKTKHTITMYELYLDANWNSYLKINGNNNTNTIMRQLWKYEQCLDVWEY